MISFRLSLDVPAASRPARHPLARRLAGLVCLVGGALVSCGGSGSDDVATAPPVSQFRSGFELRQDVQLGTGSVSDAVSFDMDGDGLSDLVETDFNARMVHGALGNEDRSFSPVFSISTPGNPWNLEVVDLTEDGEPDLVVICTATNGGQASVVLLRGVGGGSFVSDSVLPLPTDPLDVTSAEVGTAGDLRLFIALFGQGTFALSWDETAGFVLEQQLPRSMTGFSSFSVAVLDATGDALPDVVVGEISPAGADRIVVHEADPAGGFLSPTILSSTTQDPIVDRAGDVDGDGRIDLSVAQLGSTQVLLHLASAGGLQTPFALSFAGATSSVVFEDLNGDGLRDVATTLIDQGAIAVRLATAPLIWGPSRLYSVGESPRWMGVRAFGEPGAEDLFCANLRDVSILHGDGSGEFVGARGYEVGSAPQFVRVVDVDLDGHLDVVSIDLFQNEVVFMRGQGDGTFTREGSVELSPSSVETAGFLRVADFNGDGLADVATSLNSADRVDVVEAGTLGFQAGSAKSSTPVGASPLGLDTADLDGDGALDIVVANSGDGSIQALLGGGDLTFQPQVPLAVPFRPLFVVLRDFDLDGFVDAAVSTGKLDGTDANLLLLAGDGAGGFELETVLPLPHVASVFTAGDLDQDGFEDLLGSQPRPISDSLLVLRNLGTLDFDISPFDAGFRLGIAELYDLDADANLDLVVPRQDGLTVLGFGDGAGMFPKALPPLGEQIPVAFGTTTIAVADVDEDGLPDLLSVSPRSPYLWVSRNDGSLFGTPRR